MKKMACIVLTAVLGAGLLLPVSALEWKTSELINSLDTPPAYYDDAEIVEFEDSFVEGTTNARAGNYYVYLKQDSLGDFTVEFDVPETGVYDIGFTLMGWSKSVLRSTNIRVDDAAWVYVGYNYEDADQNLEHYWYGLSAVLEKGTHTFTLSLAEDFDDSTVKSLYFDYFFYHFAGAEQVAEPAAAETTVPTEVAVPAETEPAPAAAPQTFDAGLLALTGAVLSAAGVMAYRKKR